MQSPKGWIWIGPFPRLYVSEMSNVHVSILEVGISFHLSGNPTNQESRLFRPEFLDDLPYEVLPKNEALKLSLRHTGCEPKQEIQNRNYGQRNAAPSLAYDCSDNAE
jgi:hypothetical protein